MSLIIVILILFLLRYHRRAMDRASTQPVLQDEFAVRPRAPLSAGARRRSGWCNDNCRHVSRHVVCFPMAEDMYVQSSGGGGHDGTSRCTVLNASAFAGRRVQSTVQTCEWNHTQIRVAFVGGPLRMLLESKCSSKCWREQSNQLAPRWRPSRWRSCGARAARRQPLAGCRGRSRG
jgi:hypothetical protein